MKEETAKAALKPEVHDGDKDKGSGDSDLSKKGTIEKKGNLPAADIPFWESKKFIEILRKKANKMFFLEGHDEDNFVDFGIEAARLGRESGFNEGYEQGRKDGAKDKQKEVVEALRRRTGNPSEVKVWGLNARQAEALAIIDEIESGRLG